MELKNINPFVAAINEILPQFGFSNLTQKEFTEKSKKIIASGVVLTLGIVGDKKGNVVYTIDRDGAKQFASTMMMGMPVEELDEMAQSALSELSNMITANACINFSKESVNVDISVPTLLFGENIELNLNKDEITCVAFDVDGIQLEVCVALV